MCFDITFSSFRFLTSCWKSELLQEYSDFQQEVKNLKDENVISKLSDDEFSSWSKANDITRDD